MPTIYVAGPVRGAPETVLRQEPQGGGFIRRRELEGLYGSILLAAKQHYFSIFMPQPEQELDFAEPAAFYKLILGRISKASAVISVFTPYDASGPAESATAAMLGKKQLLVCGAKERVPRILLGLPGVVEVVEYSPQVDLIPLFSDFMRKYGL